MAPRSHHHDHTHFIGQTHAVGHRTLRPEGRRLAAVLAFGPDAVLSHRSAAAHWGLLTTSRQRIDVTAPTRPASGAPGIRLHRTRSLDAQDVKLDGFETHGTRAAFHADRAKDAALTASGYRVLRFTTDDDAGPVAIERLRALLPSAGSRPRSG